MKHIILFEAYRELDNSRYDNQYDRDFANYALNERPLRWDEDEIDACRAIYGNKELGTVYHGNRINDKGLLSTLEDIKSKIGRERTSLFMNLKSASPSKDEAESFALYVKSYDEMTMLRMLSQAVKHGSAGTYGGYLLTLKPTAEQVILSNFGGGKYPTTSAETEAILYGDIEVLDVEIFYPLKVDTYRQQLEDMSVSALFNDLYTRWFREHKLPRPDSTYIIKLLRRVKNEKEGIELLTSLSEGGFIFSSINVDEFLAVPILKNLLKYVSAYKDGGLAFHLANKNIHVGTIKGLHEYLVKIPKYKKEFMHNMEQILTRPFEIVSEIQYDRKGERIYNISLQFNQNSHLILSALQEFKEMGITKQHPILSEINTKIKAVLDEIVVGKHLSDIDYETVYQLSMYLQTLTYELRYLKGIIDANYIKSVMRYLYSDFAHRYSSNGSEGQAILREYGKCTAYALQIMGAL